MTAGWKIGHFRGVPVIAHPSMLIVIPLLALGITHQNLPALMNHMGLGARALSLPPLLHGLFLSCALFSAVLLHEFGHALMALKAGGRVRKISLMIFGGLTEIDHEDATPMQSALVAIAGPAVNLALGALSLSLSQILSAISVDAYVFFVLFGGLNLLLALFNLIPAMPLDGGRILHAFLRWKLSERTAQQVTAGIGRVLGIGFGVLGLVRGDLILIMIAGFIYIGASTAHRMKSLSESFSGLSARQAMSIRVVSVAPSRPVTSVARHMLMQDATAALVRDETSTYGVVLAFDLMANKDGLVGSLVDGHPIWTQMDAPLDSLVREIRWQKKPAIVLDEHNSPVGVVTLHEAVRAAELKTVADHGLKGADATVESSRSIV